MPTRADPHSRESRRGSQRASGFLERNRAVLRRSLRTVQRWERVAALPVRRVASGHSAVYAFRTELDAWWRKQPSHVTREPEADQSRQADRPVQRLGPESH